MDHGKGAGTTEPAPVGPAGDAGPMRPGGTKTPFRPYFHFRGSARTFCINLTEFSIIYMNININININIRYKTSILFFGICLDLFLTISIFGGPRELTALGRLDSPLELCLDLFLTISIFGGPRELFV